MMEKIIVRPDRIRKINGTFGFIEHRFIRKGFFYTLAHHELLLYLFMVLVADRSGLSFYGYDKICTLLRISVDEFILARDGLIYKDLLAFDGPHSRSSPCLSTVPSQLRSRGERKGKRKIRPPSID